MHGRALRAARATAAAIPTRGKSPAAQAAAESQQQGRLAATAQPSKATHRSSQPGRKQQPTKPAVHASQAHAGEARTVLLMVLTLAHELLSSCLFLTHAFWQPCASRVVLFYHPQVWPRMLHGKRLRYASGHALCVKCLLRGAPAMRPFQVASMPAQPVAMKAQALTKARAIAERILRNGGKAGAPAAATPPPQPPEAPADPRSLQAAAQQQSQPAVPAMQAVTGRASLQSSLLTMNAGAFACVADAHDRLII